jgi:hypothetical protein
VLIGGKFTRVLGHVFETHVINKDEVILPLEAKVNVALMLEMCLLSKNEAVLGYQFYADLGPKGHIAPKEFGWFMGGQKLKAAKAARLARSCTSDVASYTETVASLSRAITALKTEYDKLEEKVTSLRTNVTTWRGKVTDAKWEAAKVTRALRGKEMINAGTWKLQSKGSVKFKASFIHWKAKPANIKVQRNFVYCLGTKIIIKK